MTNRSTKSTPSLPLEPSRLAPECAHHDGIRTRFCVDATFEQVFAEVRANDEDELLRARMTELRTNPRVEGRVLSALGAPDALLEGWTVMDARELTYRVGVGPACPSRDGLPC